LLLLLLLLPSISNFQHHFSSTHHGSFSYDELLVNGSTSSSSSSQREILSRATDWPKENTTEEVKNREIQKRAFFLVVVVNLSCSRFFCVFVFVMRRR